MSDTADNSLEIHMELQHISQIGDKYDIFKYNNGNKWHLDDKFLIAIICIVCDGCKRVRF